MSQTERILSHLKRRPLTPLQAPLGANAIRHKKSRLPIGFRVGTLVVIDHVVSNGRGGYLVECDCGVTKIVRQKVNLLRSKSCGCKTSDLISASRATHGMTNTPTFRSWSSMRDRCLRESHKSFEYYKDVEICERWVNSFENFLSDMGERPRGKTLDRIDNEAGYNPSNCRWATPKTQARNRSSNVLVTYQGKTRTLVEWSEITGISQDTLGRRLQRGWSEDRVIAEPIRPMRKRVARYRLCA